MFPRASLVVGGVLMCLLYLPFTLAHGPTSINEERLILGSDMHGWGFVLGVVPNLLIAFGLRRLRSLLALERKAFRVSLSIMCASLVLSAAFDLAWQALGPPLMLFVLAPATVAAALTMSDEGRDERRLRLCFALLGLMLTSGLGVGLIPLEISDRFNGYRVFGVLTYALPGLVWALIGFVANPNQRLLR